MLISDLSMPGSGLDALQQIKTTAPNLPVLILVYTPKNNMH
jgi:DNA-binding NarL/FixJ family response regulator